MKSASPPTSSNGNSTTTAGVELWSLIRQSRPTVPAPWEAWHERVAQELKRDLFFVVGCQKSGTTWLMHLLDAHPEIICRGEYRFNTLLMPALQQALQHYNEQQRGDRQGAFTDRQFEYLLTIGMGLVFANLRGESDVKCVGEKSPEHARFVPVLSRLLPRAKFVHIVRDGRDGCVSGWFANLAEHGQSFKHTFPDLARYAEHYVTRHWVPYISSARSIARSQPQRYFELRYEDLHASPEPLIGDLLAFLGVDRSAANIARCREHASFERLSGGRQRGECDQESFFRKGIVGDWKNHFDQRCHEVFTKCGGTILRELGYE